MIYNGVLVSAVSQSESATHIHISPYLLPLASPSHTPYPTPLGGHKAPSSSPCAMWLLPTSYFTFDSVYISISLSHFVPAYPSPSPCLQVHSLHLRLYSFFFFLDSMYMFYHMVFAVLFLTYFTLCDRLQVHPPHYK